jgi:starch synthase
MVAYQYRRDAYEWSGPALMGRQSANDGFLRAMISLNAPSLHYCYTAHEQDFLSFAALIQNATDGHGSADWIKLGDNKKLETVGCLFVPSPAICGQAWHRSNINPAAYSLCGLTHSMSTKRIIEAVRQYCHAPLKEWDALVCTSTCVRQIVDRIISSEMEEIGQRFGRTEMPAIGLPIIPLGINTKSFNPFNREELRVKFRESLTIQNNDLVVLYFGRLDYLTKSNPCSLFLTVEAAQKRIPDYRVHLILAGWYSSDLMDTHFHEAASLLCPSVRVHSLNGRDPDVRMNVWHASDVFVSFADNVQESFGLTCLEAMAAGLPVIVSDWNGYRDTVRHEIDGFRIPTMMPQGGKVNEVAFGYELEMERYERYVGFLSNTVSVEISAAVEALTKLLLSPELRGKMGHDAKAHAKSTFDWDRIVEQYFKLFQELNQRRDKALASGQTARTFQRRLQFDPFALFESFPTQLVRHDSIVVMIASTAGTEIDTRLNLEMNRFCRDLLLPLETTREILLHLVKNGADTVNGLAALVGENHVERISQTVCWLAKFGIVKVLSNEGLD